MAKTSDEAARSWREQTFDGDDFAGTCSFAREQARCPDCGAPIGKPCGNYYEKPLASGAIHYHRLLIALYKTRNSRG